MQQWIQCPRCNAQNYSGQQFCWQCGQQLFSGYQQQPPVNQQVYLCPTCGNSIIYGAKFCGNCGTFLDWSAQQQPPSYNQYEWDYRNQQRRPEQHKTSPLLVGFFAIIIIGALVGGGIFAFDRLTQTAPLNTPPAIETSSQSDNTKPSITGVSVSSVTEASAVITWDTNEVASSQIEYGTSSNYGSITNLNEKLITEHNIILTDLNSNTTYHFRVKSKDKAGNEALSGENTFTTASLTEVGGIISNDTTWKKDDSPFLVMNNIQVAEGVTLTIESGVMVKFAEPSLSSAYSILVDGIIIAQGTENEKVTFTSSGSHYWGGIMFNGAGSKMNHCIIEYWGFHDADYEDLEIMKSNVMISNCIIRLSYNEHGKLMINGSPEIVDNQILTGRVHIEGGTPYLTGNRISGDGIYIAEEIMFGEPATPIITKNELSCNINNTYDAAIRIDRGSPTITYNNITGSSAHGILIIGCKPCNPIIEHNNIYDNEGYSVLLKDTDKILDFSNNWWGTTDTSEIDSAIYDSNDDYNLGTVNYQPIVTSRINGAGIQ